MFRRNRRSEGSCGPGEPQNRPETPPSSRPDPPCDPPKERVPPVRLPPVPQPPRAIPLATPQTLSAPSLAVTVTCADDYPIPAGNPDPSGADVSLAAGAETFPFRFQQVESLSAAKLNYIAGALTSDTPGVVAALNAGAAEVAALLRVTSAQAVALYDAYQEAVETATGLARSRALESLVCLWSSVETTVSCITERPGDGVAEEGPGNPVTIAAGAHTSPVSQEEADAKALEAAVDALVCTYTNDETVAECGDLGFADLNPGQDDLAAGGILGVETIGSPGPEFPGSPGRVRYNRITVAAGAVPSPESKSAATAIAMALAESQLDCFYLNAATSVTCPLTNGTVEGDWDTGTPGNFLDVPAGIAGSTVSWEDAQSLAEQRAGTLLDCFLRSAPQTVSCATLYTLAQRTVYSELAGGDIVTVANETLSPVFTVNLAAGAVVLPDTSTQAAADAAALEIAKAALECVFCNQAAISGRCPDQLTDGEDSAYSVDRTLGVLAGQICGSYPAEVAYQLDAVGLTPKIEDPENPVCTYGNTGMTVTCNPGGGDRDMKTILGKSEDYTYELLAAVTISENSYFATTLEAANELAVQVASVMLGCGYSNSEQTASCAVDEDPPDPDDTTVFAGGAIPEAITYAGEAPVSYTSQLDADTLAYLMAEAQLLCLYTNVLQTGEITCGSGEFTVQGRVPAGSQISASSTEDANSLAKSLADALSYCIDGGGGGGGGYPKREDCPICATFESEGDEDDDRMTVSGGYIRRTEPDGFFPGTVPVDGVVITPASAGWYVRATISASGPAGFAEILPGEFPGYIEMADGDQTFASFPGKGKGCGNLTFAQGFYGGKLVWYIIAG